MSSDRSRRAADEVAVICATIQNRVENIDEAMSAVWGDWEGWARALGEIHDTSRTLYKLERRALDAMVKYARQERVTPAAYDETDATKGESDGVQP